MSTNPSHWQACFKATSIGPILLTFTEKGLAGLEFTDCPVDAAPIPEALKPMVNEVTRSLKDYFAGGATDDPRIPVDLEGTPFQLQVWQALRDIPPGKTISYKALAQRLGKPQAARAVGQAVGANPIPLIIPCHRVIKADGSLGGFSSGPERKRWLLEHEGVGGGPGIFL